MLTPAERRDKKMRQMFDETGVEELTAVYRYARNLPLHCMLLSSLTRTLARANASARACLCCVFCWKPTSGL